jgi:acetoin utilization deacetylase AcuC-like enzyme
VSVVLCCALCCRGTFYPGTGAACEVGEGPGEGFTVNVPWDTDGVSDGDYMAAMEQVSRLVVGRAAEGATWHCWVCLGCCASG